MNKITEEMHLHPEWYKLAAEQTLETLPAFLNGLMNDYQHDYGTLCHAIAAGAIATAWAMNRHENGGITGFQAGAIMWQFVKEWNHSSNKTGLKLVDYDYMLFPQYADSFSKTISSNTFEVLKKEAAKNLERDLTYVSPDVVKHWQSIVEGRVPFGYSISKE